MAIFYDYYSNPPRGEEKPKLHPRPVVIRTVKTEELAELISQGSSFSPGDVIGVLDSLSYWVSDGLQSSCNVYLEGLGTFYISLESRPVESISEIRSASIQIKSIHFRPDKQFLMQVNRADIKRVRKPRKPSVFTEEERYKRILWYIDRYEGINITTVMQINHCNHKKAKEDVGKLIEKGIIRAKRFGNVDIYLRNE